MTKRRFIDLNSRFIQTHTFTSLWKEVTDEFRQNDFRSIDGLHSLRLRVSPLRRALSRKLQSQKFFLLGSVSNPRLRATHLSRESQRYRSVSASSTAKTLSYGPSRFGFAQHLGQRQSGARLENLRRFRPYPHPRGTQPLQGRAVLGLFSTKPSMHWMPPPSIYACRFSPGRSFADTSRPSSFTPCSICAAVFPPWSLSRVDRSTRSTSSIS
jgi:hypothetical protein